MDIKGYDTANKLYIILKSLGEDIDYSDISIRGIQNTNLDSFQQLEQDDTLKLVATAEFNQEKNKFVCKVEPQKVLKSSFLGSASGTDMCIQVTTDLFETISLKTNETGVYPTAAAVLRDVIHLT